MQRELTHSALMLLTAGEVPLCQLTGRRWSDCTLHDPRLAAGRYCDASVTSCQRRTEFIELWDRQAGSCPSLLYSAARSLQCSSKGLARECLMSYAMLVTPSLT